MAKLYTRPRITRGACEIWLVDPNGDGTPVTPGPRTETQAQNMRDQLLEETRNTTVISVEIWRDGDELAYLYE